MDDSYHEFYDTIELTKRTKRPPAGNEWNASSHQEDESHDGYK